MIPPIMCKVSKNSVATTNQKIQTQWLSSRHRCCKNRPQRVRDREKRSIPPSLFHFPKWKLTGEGKEERQGIGGQTCLSSQEGGLTQIIEAGVHCFTKIPGGLALRLCEQQLNLHNFQNKSTYRKHHNIKASPMYINTHHLPLTSHLHTSRINGPPSELPRIYSQQDEFL